ncbi:MAG: nitroreductase family protein [Burkholderiales bacterium]
MDAMQLLHTRYSALKLGEPAPSAQALRAIIESAAHVPDHGRLQPWRLILIESDARLSLPGDPPDLRRHALHRVETRSHHAHGRGRCVDKGRRLRATGRFHIRLQRAVAFAT